MPSCVLLTCVHWMQEKQGTAKYGTIQGAVRLSEEAAIGTGHWMSAHGGAVSCSAALDCTSALQAFWPLHLQRHNIVVFSLLQLQPGT